MGCVQSKIVWKQGKLFKGGQIYRIAKGLQFECHILNSVLCKVIDSFIDTR